MDFVELPVIFESLETLEFLGFMRETASLIWHRWSDIPAAEKAPEGLLSLEDLAHSYVRACPYSDTHVKLEDRLGITNGWGMKQRFGEILIDPQLQILISTETTGRWVSEIIHLRWEELLLFQAASQQRAGAQRERSVSEYVAPPHRGVRLRDGGRGKKDSTEFIASRIPGYTILYRGTLKDRAEAFVKNKDIDQVWLWRSPSDFHGRNNELGYFTLELEVAQDYARMSRRSLEVMSTRIIVMKIPNHLIHSLQPRILRGDRLASDLWKQDEWREWVWLCRRGNTAPSHLSHLAHCKLYIGHIARNDTKTIAKMKSWMELTLKENGFVLRAQGDGITRYATQYVFQGHETMRRVVDGAIELRLLTS